VSFGVDPANGRRLRRKIRGRTQELVANKVRALERERDAGVRRTTTRTVASWLEEWIVGRELEVRRTTVLGYRADLPHIVRTLGRARIEQLTPEQVEAMYRDCLAVGLSTGTIRHIRRTLSAAMTTAVDRDTCCATPCDLRPASPTSYRTSSPTTRNRPDALSPRHSRSAMAPGG
jgi:integrase